MLPKYPIYIISKGRWESRLTANALEEIKAPYHIVVEPQEYKEYAKVIAPKKIYTLPFKNLGKGSIPARNWVFEHSISIGAKRHWILDDNIHSFLRQNNNVRIPVATPTFFRIIEDFSDRYENIAISGPHYYMFAPDRSTRPPFYLNTRVYSCILINNKIPYRWRGRYNEDTDLSLRVLKDGWCTILFNALLCLKNPTMRMKGGNTDELYKQDKEFDGRLEMAKSLKEQHPNLVKIVKKWGRWQHSVNYKPFFNRNKLKLKKGIKIKKGIDNYGLKLQQLKKEKI